MVAGNLPMKTPRIPRSRSAFTLIELLVVISIIAILAGLTFSGVTGAMVSAKKVQAKNDMSQIAMAVQAYYTEYGRYPIDITITTDDKAVYGSGQNNALLINVLRYDTSASSTITDAQKALNTRQIQFLQPKLIDATKAGVNKTSGNWYDPWGAQYIIFVDADYAGDIDATAVGITTAKPQFNVGVASVGYSYAKSGNKAPTTSLPNPIPNDKTTFLLSWQ